MPLLTVFSVMLLWIEDLKEDAEEKTDALTLNLPGAQIEKINKTRAAFTRAKRPYKLKGRGRVRGGVATGKATYVSWVDELVWHSTPAPLSRTEYYKTYSSQRTIGSTSHTRFKRCEKCGRRAK
jgi:hypothetical protein